MAEASRSRLEAAEEVVVGGEAGGNKAGLAETSRSREEADFQEKILQLQQVE